MIGFNRTFLHQLNKENGIDNRLVELTDAAPIQEYLSRALLRP